MIAKTFYRVKKQFTAGLLAGITIQSLGCRTASESPKRGGQVNAKIIITPEINPDNGQTVYHWQVGELGGYCATKEDALNDAKTVGGAE